MLLYLWHVNERYFYAAYFGPGSDVLEVKFDDGFVKFTVAPKWLLNAYYVGVLNQFELENKPPKSFRVVKKAARGLDEAPPYWIMGGDDYGPYVAIPIWILCTFPIIAWILLRAVPVEHGLD